MAIAERTTSASPAQVFAVLADGWTYAGWVVGSSHVRAVSAAWPTVGAQIHHASGAWPAVVRDSTVVEDVVPDERLVLTASARPLGSARIELTLLATPGGCRMRMMETPVEGPGAWVNNPFFERILQRRITETLARLAAYAERPTSPPD